MRLGSSKYEVGIEILEFLNVDSLMRVIMLMCKDSLYIVNTLLFFAVQPL